MRKKIKELYEHSTLVAKIRYSYLCLLVPFVLFLIFCFYNLWNNNRRYEDMINSSVMASQFSLDFQKDFDYETYLLIVGNKTLEESSLHDMLVEADGIVAGLEELTESQENLKRLTSVKKYLNNLETYIGRIEDNIREGNRYEDNMEIWENDVQIVTSLVGDTMSQYIYYEIRGIQESRQQYQDFFVNMIRFSIIAFTLILVLFLFLSYYIPLSITSPIRRLTQVTDQVAKGDLTVRSDVTGGVEAQVLSDSLNTMIDKINELLEQVKTEQIRLRKAEFELLHRQNAEEDDLVLIHDAARPLLSQKLIADCEEAIRGHDGVLPVLPMKDTVYYSKDGRQITSLLDRQAVFAGQAPELFRLGTYYQANERLLPEEILRINGSTEPAVLAGMQIAMVPGDERNFKITTPADLERFRQIVENEA